MKEKGLALVILALLLVLTSACTRPIHSQGIGPQIDLYTQREPYSGRGLNMPSDAFGPGEEIKIYAYVTYNDYPVHGALVAYGVFGPSNSSSRIVFYRSGSTDENGTAVITFRVSYLNEENFGNWTVIGNTNIAGSTVHDTVPFRVGWLVEFVSARTLNETNHTQTGFTHRSIVGVELILKSIAMTERSATISIMVNDSLNMRVASIETNNFVIPPNEIPVESYSYFSIPDHAHLGFATISAGLYTAPLTEGGTAYSPEVLAHFMIVTRDVAVINVIPSTQHAFIGTAVNISVTVKNLGLFSESFNVMLRVNSTAAGTLTVTNLEAGTQETLIFTWDTHGFDQGIYTLSALASQVQDETNTGNNLYTDGVVELKAQPTQPILFHDVAVVGLTPSSTLAFTGATLDITVVVVNKGNYTESFNVTVHYDSVAVGTIEVSNLDPSGTNSLVFHWNTQNVAEGNYTLSASASAVPEEVDLANNGYTDGTVRLIVPGGSWFVFEWWYLLLLLLLLLLIIILILWLYRRRKKKEKNVGGSFDAAWSAWYYGYSLSNRYLKS